MFKPQPFHLLQMVSWKGSRFCTSQVKFDSTRISVLNCARDMTIHVATQTLCAAYFKSDLPGVVWCMLAWPYLSSEAHKIHTMKQLWGWNRLSTVSLLERWRHSLQDARSRTAIPGNYQAAGQSEKADWAKSAAIHVQAFDDDRKDDDVLAEEHRVEQSLFQSSNQASIKSSNSATCYAYTCCNEFPAISKGNAWKCGFEPFSGYFDVKGG